MIELDRPRVLATDRSISPVTMMKVIGRATSTMGIRSRIRKVKLRLGPKLVTDSEATTSTKTVSRTMMVSQEEILRLSSDMGVLLPQRAGDPDRDQAVRADGQDDQGADDGLLPELVDVQHGQGAADHGQQQRAEAGAPDRAA